MPKITPHVCRLSREGSQKGVKKGKVDLVAHDNIGTYEWLTKAERSSLAHVLHNACLVNGTKVSVLYAIELMSESYKRILMHESEEELVLPTVISIESMEGITE